MASRGLPSDAGVLVFAPWAACPPGVKLPLGSLPPWGEAASGQLAPRAWAACPPPQENLTELNAERFFFFFNKILIIETWEN